MYLGYSRVSRKGQINKSCTPGIHKSVGYIRLTVTAGEQPKVAMDIIKSGQFDHQSQHIALYVLSIRQGPDGVALRDLTEGTGWSKSVVRQVMIDLIEAGLVERVNVLCSYCSRLMSGDDTHVDHVVARSLGGSDIPDNRVPVCQPCNSKKSNKPFLQWLAEVGRTSE
jgi:hypothetical protein